MIKSYKIRLLPTPEQEQILWQHAGAARFIWNWALDYQQRWYELGERHLSAYELICNLPALKRKEEHMWLKDISAKMLQTVLLDLEEAYQDFFKRGCGFPKFKTKKRSVPKFPVRSNIRFTDGCVSIEKIKMVKFQTNYTIPETTKYSNPRIKYTNGKWMLSFGIEREIQAHELTDIAMGIDLGVKDLATVAFGEEKIIFHNINKSKRMRNMTNKLKHLQRNVSRKYCTNGNYEKTKAILKIEKQISELYHHIACKRKDYTHKTTRVLVEMLPKRITMEDLNVIGMMKNRYLSRAIAEQTFHEFIRQMRYKCEWNGIEFKQVGRFYASSKICSSCGAKKDKLMLKERIYVCNECGSTLDRDYNAALNLMRYTS